MLHDRLPPDVTPGLAASPEFVGRAGAVLERLQHLYPVLIDLSLGRLEGLLARLDHPERHLPPVIHVAGTNGKGSTAAHLRAIAEASGWMVHVSTSPHLVDVRERFRIAGRLVSEAALTGTLEEIEHVNAGRPITVFEVLTASAFLLFSRHPADLAVIEVGLGGRHDASNVIPPPAACVITSISMDHEAFLGDSLEAIAGEKAGIIKPGTPVVTGRQPEGVLAVIADAAARAGAPLLVRDREWSVEADAGGLLYADRHGRIDLPLPALSGRHQVENAGLAVAALRAAGLAVPPRGCLGLASTAWPARLQRLTGRLAAALPRAWELWLDGGHNPGAAVALGEVLAGWADRPVHLIIGMKQSKDARGFLTPLLDRAASVHAVAEPGQHLALPVEAIIAASDGRALHGPTVAGALSAILAANRTPGRILICGSLYLAGEVLKAEDWQPE